MKVGVLTENRGVARGPVSERNVVVCYQVLSDETEK